MNEVVRRQLREQIDRIRKIESIFSPHTNVFREWKRAADNPGVPEGDANRGHFAHYTSAEAALKIISSKRLWMRNTTSMIDYREVEHGFEMLVNYFRGAHENFFAASDRIKPGLAKAAVDMFDEWWKIIRVNTYIASVTDHLIREENSFGRLSMWRAFGMQPRVALVFSVPWFSLAPIALSLNFSPVSYLSEQKFREALDTMVLKIGQEAAFLSEMPNHEFQGAIFQMLVSAVCCSKHEGFQEEREWRGVYTDGFGLKTLLEKSVETIQGVPQVIFKVPFDKGVSEELADLDLATCLERVIIGPSAYSWIMYRAFVDTLEKIGVPDASSKVWTSNLPIRE